MPINVCDTIIIKNHSPNNIMWYYYLIKGVSTAEGGRGHVTTYMYSVTIKV